MSNLRKTGEKYKEKLSTYITDRSVTVRDSFLGPTWLIRCSLTAYYSPVIKLDIRHPERKKQRKNNGGISNLMTVYVFNFSGGLAVWRLY